jgi:hypothetical protein
MSSYHTELVRKFDASQDASQAARTEAERGRDYYDGKQLTPDQIKALQKRKQPIVIENLIRGKVNYLCGLERQQRTDPKAYPRTAQHEDDANAITDALRYVVQDQNFPIKRSAVFQHMLVEGFGGVEVFAERVRNAIDPAIKQIDWDRLFYDPHSCKPDFSDANYLGYVTWMDIEEAKRRWQGKDAILDATFQAGASSIDETFDDKPKWKTWVDTNRKRVRIVTIYDRSRGEWERCVFTLSGELEPCEPSPFVDEDGKPECALILQSAYVDRDNDRYGIVRDDISIQDEVNKRRSKFLHIANSRQVRVSPAAAIDPEDARREMSRPDGIIIADQGDVEVIDTGAMAAGHFNLLAEAKQAIQMTGPNATLQGKSGQDQSGRAILALQQGGMTEMAPIMDALRHFNVRVYRAIWNRIRQFWKEERWVRITDDERNVRFVGLNTTKGMLAAMKVRDALKAGEIDEAQAQQFAMQIQQDPMMMQPANNVAEVDVDIEFDEVADAPTLRMEQFDTLAKIIPAAPQPYIPVMFRMMIEASDLRNKDQLLKVAQELESPQQPDPAQEQMKALAMAAAQAEVEKTQSETAKNEAQAQATTAKVMLDSVQAGFAVG